MIGFIDTETYSEIPLKAGTYRYAEECEVMIVSYALGDGPSQVWDATDEIFMPNQLDDMLQDERIDLVAHGAMFDRNVLARGNLGVDIPIKRWRCSMAKALAHSLPGGLDKLCTILKIPEDSRKQTTGKELIRLFCVPRPKKQKVRRYTRETHPEDWAKFLLYAKVDTDAHRAVWNKLPSWNYRGDELALWRLDQTYNDRGLLVDTDLARAAIHSVDVERAHLATRTAEVTDDVVASTTQRDALLAHILAEYGVELPNMKADTLERRLNDPELPDGVRELIAIRLQASQNSPAKYKALLNAVNADGRMRGTSQWCGASRTGRNAGRTFQPTNLARVPPYLKKQYDFAVSAIKNNVVDLFFENPIEVCASVVRGSIIAPPGKKFCDADLRNIEGRFAAFLAGEQWKLDAFRRFDTFKLDANGDRIPDPNKPKEYLMEGPDLYCVAYARAFGIDPADVDEFMRQIGKVIELFMQYQGGVGAFITGAVTYGIDLEDLARAALPTIPVDVLDEAEDFFRWSVRENRNTFALPEHVFVACDSLKRLSRGAQPHIVNIWSELEYAARDAIRNPGREFKAGKHITFRRDAAWLRMFLPSGRSLCYPHPRVSDSGKISYAGVNQYSRKWERLGTYGGKLFENATQGGSRDVFWTNVVLAEAEGYETVLTVYDQDLAEVPDTPEFSADRLAEILSTPIPWAPGLPLSAGGYETYRFRKD